jgi:fumarate hydratase subunit beta
MRIPITTPLVDVDHLKTGDLVAISGVIYTGRDAAHKRFIEDMKAGKGLPFDPKNQILYYVGPTPKNRAM